MNFSKSFLGMIAIFATMPFVEGFSSISSHYLKKIQKPLTTLASTTVPKEEISNFDGMPTPINPSSTFGSPIAPELSSFNRAAISFIKNSLFDKLFDTSNSNDREYILSRSYARFYALETIARMPYFSYLSVLHLYETLGWWRRADYLKVHFCESWNELHHLLIMEELGGHQRFVDRFIAQHSAFFYYWFVVFFYMANPVFAYNLNEAIEEHAVETYSTFLQDFEEVLKSKEPCKTAKEYYLGGGGDMYLFDEMHICAEPMEGPDFEFDADSQVIKRRPKIENLYDVFVAIRNDEMEHVKTMQFLQEKENDIQICNIE